MKEKKINTKRRFILLIRISGISIASIFLIYLITKHAFNWHFSQWGDKLIELEKKDKLSKDYDIWNVELEGDTLDSLFGDIPKKGDTIHIGTKTPVDSIGSY